MSGYTTRLVTLRLGGIDYRIRALSDRQQFSDPNGAAERAGISSANWCLFGQVWPAGRVLAQAMSSFDVAGKRILELGCGLGLSSLVLNRRKADITASDHHPLAEEFLTYNAALNGLSVPSYLDISWTVPQPDLGKFDLIIASDVLYERGHAEQLSSLLSRHANDRAEVLITDPGRGNSGAFTTAMKAQGYAVDEVRSAFDDGDVPPFRGRLLSYRR
ncbi:MAG: methyltransferase [Arenimonas sp.]|uniref:class I SAM-dependent methyltransferase n=1 Tax=Arenimonas sp. TaxID=1872635 RepID=UPI0025C51F2A|nr:methyltransferase domain-containing protein [Arenimonas sp.]MBW8368053.1 methyltransferase [Arenimonas sp.]